MIISAVALAGVFLLTTPGHQDPAPEPRATIAPAADLDTLTLVMSTTGQAVVRVGPNAGGAALLVVKPGDRIGRSAATVREIDPGRMVLDELTRDSDGRPRRAQLVLREGESGPRRYMRDAGRDAAPGVRPKVVGRERKPAVGEKSGTRP